MKHVTNTTLCEESFSRVSKLADKPEFIDKAIAGLKGKCPHCKKPWPKAHKSKHKLCVRLPDATMDKLEGIGNVSRFIAVAVNESLGLCPLCEQPE